MTTTTELVKVNPQEYGLEEKDKESLTIGLKSVLEAREILLAEFDEVSKLEITKENLPKFKELRLKFQKNRTQGILEWHKKAKEVSLRTGQLLDAIKRNEIFVNEQKEEFLEKGEKHFENLEKERISKLNSVRIELIREFVSDTTGLDFGNMQEDVWNAYYNAKKQEHADKLEAEAKLEREREAQRIAEEERKKRFEIRNKELSIYWATMPSKYAAFNYTDALEEEYAEMLIEAKAAKIKHEQEQEEIRIENEKLRKAAEAREKAIEAERLENERKLSEERAKAKAIADKKEAENQAKLKAEREANAKLEAELKAKKDAEIKAENERKDAELKAQKEAAKLAKAPIKKQLNTWVDYFELPSFTTENETAKIIMERFDSFKNWAKSEIEKI